MIKARLANRLGNATGERGSKWRRADREWSRIIELEARRYIGAARRDCLAIPLPRKRISRRWRGWWWWRWRWRRGRRGRRTSGSRSAATSATTGGNNRSKTKSNDERYGEREPGRSTCLVCFYHAVSHFRSSSPQLLEGGEDPRLSVPAFWRVWLYSFNY